MVLDDQECRPRASNEGIKYGWRQTGIVYLRSNISAMRGHSMAAYPAGDR